MTLTLSLRALTLVSSIVACCAGASATASASIASISQTGATLGSAQPNATQDLYVQGSTLQETYSTSSVPIAGMSLTLPAATASDKFAIVTFSAPYEDTECGDYEITVGPTNYGVSQVCSNTSIMFVPVMIMTKIPLTSSTQIVQADFNGIGGDPVAIEVFYSLTALLTKN